MSGDRDGPVEFKRPEHRVIADLLGAMNADWLLDNACFFGGGTAIVLRHGEYRLSRDLDFLCSDAEGFRRLRTVAVREGVSAFFGPQAERLRDVRADQYGLRTVVGWRGERIKFEVVREARIAVGGAIDPVLGVPTLSAIDQFAEKLLANADRGIDRSFARRDAIDLGYLLQGYGAFPAEAVAKAEAAYGEDVADKMARVLGALADRQEILLVAQALGMTPDDVAAAVRRLGNAARTTWPTLPIPAPDITNDPTAP